MLDAGAGIAVWASLMDYAGTGQYARSGLVRMDRTVKAAFAAYRDAAAGRAGELNTIPVAPTSLAVR
jgi:hypothetical protein